ncbi:YciI family protein [Thermodesulfobacteriota bacterium]
MKEVKRESQRGISFYVSLLIVVIMLLGLATFAMAESTCIKKGNTYYTLINIPGENFAAKATDPKLKAEYEKHKAYMGSLGAKGQTLLGGPFKWKKGGGMSVLTVKTMEEAKAIAEEDPAYKSGIYKYAIYPWMPVSVAKPCR